jgi:hypothetical protein
MKTKAVHNSQFAEQRKLGKGLAKIGGATLALSPILDLCILWKST